MSSATEICENSILTYLATNETSCTTIVDTYPWAMMNHLDPLVVIGAVNSLLTEGYVSATDLTTSFYTLSTEGQSILEHGSQEMRVLRAIQMAGRISMTDLEKNVGTEVTKIGMGNCMKNKWVKKEGTDLVPLITMEEAEDSVQKALHLLQSGGFALDAIDDKVLLSNV